ncbi:MAG: TonB-dependent receptor [Muribaculaceae bacterium]|nr:TonB-dependent receptor [Muribaculaceae bacterium]
MIKHILLSAATALSTCGALATTTTNSAHSDANIYGHVIDIETGEHQPYFLIRLAGTQTATMTDASGHYQFLDLTPGTYTIEASSTGWITAHQSVTVEAGKSLEINFNVETDAFMLEQVVVTGSKSELKRLHSPALVSVVSDKLFSLVNACSLADGLCYQPGVRVENDCQNCGFTQVRINGLDGHYSQILMNSRPVFSALAGVYGLEQIPANMIDRVEVMRGGGSALFGSSAIGGTVNIITRDPVINYAEVQHSLNSIGISGALDNNTTLNASVVTDNSKFGFFVYGQNRSRDGYDNDGDGFTEIAELKSQTLGLRGVMKPNDDTRLTLEYHGTHEYRRGGDQLERPAHDAMIAEQVEHNINAGELSFDIWSTERDNHINIFSAMQNIKRKSYYGSEQDPNAYGRTHDFVINTGVQWTHTFHRLWFMPAELMAGVEYNFNYLNDVTLGYNHDTKQKVNIYSAYAQNEWRNGKWGFLIGTRIDKHSMISHAIFSPRANIRYNPTDKVNLRLSYSSGFRSPQAYEEDFHVAIVGGERLVTVLATNLKEESSSSVSISADIYQRIGAIQANFMLEGFYTDLRDVFALRQLPDLDNEGNAVLERYNGSGATVVGVNTEIKVGYSRWQLQGGITWQKSRYKNPEYWSDNTEVAPVKRMFRTPDLYGYVTLTYDITKKLRAAFTGTYTGDMLVQHLQGSGTPIDVAVTTPNFFDAGFKLSYEFTIFKHACLEASIGITNLFNSYQCDFDTGYLRDSGYIYGPSTPRSINASIKLHL